MGQILDTGLVSEDLLDANGEPILDEGFVVVGTVDDFAQRLRVVLPDRWFTDDAPVLAALLQGLGAGWAALYDQVAFTRLQTRIATATGAFLDMAALDYLGGRLVRKPGESDAVFSAQVRAEIIRPRATRAALILALKDLTGRTPRVFEPALPTDTGGYGSLGMTVGTGFGYGLAGGWGSLALHSQVFVTAYRATGGGIPAVMGYYNPGTPMYAGTATLSGMSSTVDNSVLVGSTDVTAPISGYTVAKHTRGTSLADTNVGYVFCSNGAAPTTTTASARVYIPSSWVGQSITFQIEGAGWSGFAYADTTQLNQWQTVSVQIVSTAGATANPALVLRVYGPPGTVVYSAGWQAGVQPWAGGGYGVGAIEWASLDQSAGQVTDADIYAAVESVMPAAGIAWTAVSN